MQDSFVVFFGAAQLPLLKLGFFQFDTWGSLADPYLENRRIYQPPHVVEPMSDSEFAEGLKGHYEAMDDAMKNMVTWEYYLEQALKNRANIESQLQKPVKPDTRHFPLNTHYSSVCCLRIFKGIHQDVLWQTFADGHQGFAVEVDIQHEYFQSAHYAQQPQICKAITYDDTRPPPPSREEPFPALFHRPHHCQFENEYRLLRPKVAADKDGVLFKIPKGVVTGIYLGMQVPKTLVQEFRQLIKLDLHFRHLPIYHMGVSQEYLRLVPMPLE